MDTEPTGLITIPSVDVSHYFTSFINFFTGHGGDFWHSAQRFVGVIVGISIPVSIFFLFSIIITVESLKKIRNIERDRFMKPPPAEKKEQKIDAELAQSDGEKYSSIPTRAIQMTGSRRLSKQMSCSSSL
jgi:hypothetical protein